MMARVPGRNRRGREVLDKRALKRFCALRIGVSGGGLWLARAAADGRRDGTFFLDERRFRSPPTVPDDVRGVTGVRGVVVVRGGMALLPAILVKKNPG